MSGEVVTLTAVLNSVEDILSSVGGPIVLATLGFGILALFLRR